MNLLSSATADGSGSAMDWPSGLGNVRCTGTFDGATVTLESSSDGGSTWLPVGADATFTEAGQANFSLGPCKLRGTVSGAGGSTSVTLAI